MKYRIKITTFSNGRKEFRPYVKKMGLWFGIDYNGDVDFTYSSKSDNREEALGKIDMHYKGNCRKQTIEFEYLEL